MKKNFAVAKKKERKKDMDASRLAKLTTTPRARSSRVKPSNRRGRRRQYGRELLQDQKTPGWQLSPRSSVNHEKIRVRDGGSWNLDGWKGGCYFSCGCFGGYFGVHIKRRRTRFQRQICFYSDIPSPYFFL